MASREHRKIFKVSLDIFQHYEKKSEATGNILQRYSFNFW